MNPLGLSPAALKKAEEIAYRQVAERCKVDLFYLNKYVLNCDIIDEFVHGPLCAATRNLLYWKDKAYAQKFEFPSDWGRTEEEGLPTAAEKIEFLTRVDRFIPGDRDESGVSEMYKEFNPDLHALLALVPRGTLKTTTITIGFVLQWFLVHPDSRVLIDSETSTNSSNFLAEIKGHLEGNDAYREVFKACHGVYPDANSKDKNTRWNNSMVDLACRKKPKKEPSIDTGGVDTTKNSRHYDLIIFDDLHSEINTQTKEQIEKVKTHWKLAFSLLDPNCPSLVIGTRWDFNDLYQMIIDEHLGEYNVIARRATDIDNEELLYPKQLDRAFLDNKRSKQGSYIYSCQYNNEPVDAETAKFKRDYFQYRNLEEVEGMPINWYLTIDPGGDGKNSDFAGFVLSGMDYQDNLYVRYIRKAKMTEGEIVMHTIELFRKFQPKRIVVETLAGAGKSIIMAYKTKMKELGIWLPIQYIEHRVTQKATRIEALAPKYEFGHVFHIRECPQLKELEEELLKFPKAKNDDVSDAFATVLEVATPPMRNQKQHTTDLERKKRLKKLNAPRSAMIGY